jgi:hypothetical protein
MDNNSPVVVHAAPPAEGERRALRGYVGRYEKAGAAIYAALERDQLRWIGVADRSAGIDDDSIWGEGCYVALTEAGLAQFRATRGKFVINVFASREVHKSHEYGERFFETAKNSYSI